MSNPKYAMVPSVVSLCMYDETTQSIPPPRSYHNCRNWGQIPSVSEYWYSYPYHPDSNLFNPSYWNQSLLISISTGWRAPHSDVHWQGSKNYDLPQSKPLWRSSIDMRYRHQDNWSLSSVRATSLVNRWRSHWCSVEVRSHLSIKKVI